MSPLNIPSHMRAAVLTQFNQPYEVQIVSTPSQLYGHDLLVRVLAASYCHTDALLAAGSMSRELPRVGCHEFAGRVVGIGSEVSSNLGIALGDEVGVPGRAYHPCGSCYECKLDHGDPQGYSPYCSRAKNLGLTTDGGFGDYALVDSRQVAPIPHGMSALETAPLMCAGLTIWSALERVKEANTIAIVGAGGGLGHLGVQFAAHLGRTLLAVDTGKTSLKLLDTLVKGLRRVDAPGKITIADSKSQEPESVVSTLGGGGVEAVILLPQAQEAFDYGMRLLRDHGTMVVVSFPEKLEFSAKDLVFRDIRVVGSLVGRNHQLRAMLRFASKHGVRAVTKSFSLHQINELVEEYRAANGGKLVVDMTTG